MTNKINYDSMKKLFDEQLCTFVQTNTDYGNSFERSLEKNGLLSSIVRMEDKMNRLSTLAPGDKDAQIASESLVDTLMDLSNYAAMSACWLMHKDDEFDNHISKGFSGSVVVTGKEDLETVKNLFHLSSFEGHQEKVNERAYYDRDDITDEEIIKNWGLVGDSKTVRSRTTGWYLTENDNPELFRKIYGILQAYNGYESFKKMKDKLTGTDEEFEGRFNDLKETVFEQINHSREVVTTELKGLENGYVIRQHKNSHSSYRYTLAFNPEGTLKVEGEVAKPYVIECFSNDYVGTNTWAIHVFDTREDMVAALNYDLRVRRLKRSKNFGDSIKELDVKVDVFTRFDAPKVLNIWDDTFGEAFNNQMLSKDLNTEESIEKYHGIKTFGPVFISEKTGALLVKYVLRDSTTGQNNNIIWFSDTKEVLLELKNTIPKFNANGIIYGIDSKHVKNGDNLEFNPLYQDMEDKILSKFYSYQGVRSTPPMMLARSFWGETELKNLVFFNEDEAVSCEFTEKRMQIPNYLACEKPKNTVGLDNFGALESGNLTSKNGKLGFDLNSERLVSGEIS